MYNKDWSKLDRAEYGNLIKQLLLENEKKKAIERIKFLKQKLDGTDPELEQMQKDLAQLEPEMQAAIERFMQPKKSIRRMD